MSRPVAILRPEPGNRASCARAQALGLRTIALPLFAVGPVAWTPPDPAAHDALVLTSANALRWGGPGLAQLTGLPVFAVGVATAAAATERGFTLALTGASNADALLAQAAGQGICRALHLGGRESTIAVGPVVTESIAVYASDPRPLAPAAMAARAGSIAVLHSPRAARHLAAGIDTAGVDRAQVTIAAFSQAVATAAGTGWQAMIVAEAPDDAALFAQIARLRGSTD